MPSVPDTKRRPCTNQTYCGRAATNTPVKGGFSRVYTLDVPGYVPGYDQHNQAWYLGTPEYTRAPQSIPGYPRVYPGTQEYTRVSQSMPECTPSVYPSVPQSTYRTKHSLGQYSYFVAAVSQQPLQLPWHPPDSCRAKRFSNSTVAFTRVTLTFVPLQRAWLGAGRCRGSTPRCGWGRRRGPIRPSSPFGSRYCTDRPGCRAFS